MLMSSAMPLSHGQQALWFIYHRAPDSAAYNMSLPLRFAAPLEPRLMGLAVAQLVEQHPMLRTCFREREGRPYQLPAELEPRDYWRQVEAADWDEATLSSALRERSQQPFVLEKQSFRADLFHRPGNASVVLLSLHHIAGDAASLSILGQQLVQCYAALVADQTPRLPPPAQDYGDYIRWEAAHLEGARGARMATYWRAQLGGDEVPVLQLPTDGPRPAQQSFHGDTLFFDLSEALSAALRRSARQQKTSLFSVLLSTWQVLMHRYSGQTRIWTGVPTSTPRNQAGFADTVGYLVNPMIVHADFPAEDAPSFARLIQQNSRQILAGLYHQPYPFAWLIEQLQPQRDPSYPPLVQTLFALEKADLIPRRFEAAGIVAERLDIAQMEAQFDLSLTCTEAASEAPLKGILTYNRDLFSEATVQRMVGHLCLLLESLAADPQQRIDRPVLLTPGEQQSLRDWNCTTRETYPRISFLEYLARQVAARPEHTAVETGEQRLSYAQLNRAANQLAHQLIARDIGADTLVGLYLERSPAMIIALLGILKTGAAYLPLDPDHPAARLHAVLADAEPALVLTQRDLQNRLPSTQVQLCMDQIQDHLDGLPDHDPAVASSADDLAYMIYTSGSTGTPKGVMLEHQGLSNLIAAQVAAFAITPESRLLQFAAIGFDASVSEIATALSAGATLVLGGTEKFLPDEHFIRLLQEQAISHITLPPSFLGALPETELPALRTLVTAGEACPAALVQRWAPGRRFINAYGPTENTVCASLTECRSDDPGPPPIGRPMANVQVYILDAHGNPQPPGVPGELCIAGVGLARGYHRRPELSAERFVQREILGERLRLYHSGDLARWRADGQLEYLGRLDHQVKLRGFRIELGEIEAQLRQHPAVRDAVVVLYRHEGHPQLAAYATLEAAPGDAADSLRQWLAERLPDYMLPASFTVLETLPVTASGKIDRRALPAPELVGGQRHEAPRTAVEAQLAEIWAQVLKRPGVGIHDNFFHLGGDSILSIQIIARARALGLGLPSQALFQHQSIAELARVVEPLDTVAVDQGSVSGTSRLTPIQQRFFEQQLPEPAHFNQAALLRVPRDIRAEALQGALAALIHHHDALRLRFARDGEDWLAHHEEIDPDAPLPWQVEDLEADGADFAAALTARCEHWQRSLDITRGPLLRLVLLRGTGEARLFLCVHHLVVDGVSLRILLEDLHTAYGQIQAGQAPALPPRTHAFRDWAEALQAWAGSEACAIQADYWRQLPGPSPLPCDNPDDANRREDCVDLVLRFSAVDTHRLLSVAPAAFRTRVNDLLLTALLLALRDWRGAGTQLIDIESHGRADIAPGVDISRTVGWFTALHSVALSLPESDDPGVLLRAVKEQLRAVPHDGIGYGVQRYLHGENLPRGQILFNYLGQFQAPPGDDWQWADEDSGAAFSPLETREHRIEINGRVLDGELGLDWTYSPAQLQPATMAALADSYRHHLLALLDHCERAWGYSPTDFPLAGLIQARVDELARHHGNTIADVYPLSPMQQGLLFHSILEPDGGLYFEQFHFRLEGSLDPDALQGAWQSLIRRHPVLRTAFWYAWEEPLQVVLEDAPLDWRVLDWRKRDPAAREAALQDLLDRERARGFDLTRAPLLRLQLIREGEAAHRLVWHFHHTLMDGWSFPLLLTELFSSYRGLLGGPAPSLSTPPPYRDYIQWLATRDHQADEAYWRSQLAGFSVPVQIPLPAPVGGEGRRYRSLEVALPAALSQRLDDFGREHRLTLNTLLQGAWAVLLGRYSGCDDVVFGVTVSGRQVPIPGVENTVGLFINTLPLRVQLDAGDLPTVLHAIQQQQQAHNEYAHTPLASIQRCSQVEAGTALFDTLLAFENYPVDAALLQAQQAVGLHLTDIQAVEFTNYALTLVIIPGEQLRYKLIWDNRRFQTDGVARMLAHLQKLLTSLVAQPTLDWRLLDLQSEADRAHWRQLNDTRQDYPGPHTLVELFNTQVAATPDHPALIFSGETLSYRELDCRANQLAHHLMDLGVTAETLVGICMERSPLMVVGLLGILKAGGAYVAMDPDYPAERIRFTVEDSRAPFLLSQQSLVGALPTTDARLICLDRDWPEIAGRPAEAPPPQSGPNHLAYVIYTSGSTGKPKGVAIEHHSAATLVHWAHGEYSAEQLAGVLAGTSICFDLSVFELFVPLSRGGTVILLRDILQLAQLDEDSRRRISLINTVPSAARSLLEMDAIPDNVQVINLAGEPLKRRLVDGLYRQTSVAHVYNLYGPSEDTTYSTFVRLPREDDQEPSIGVPLANTRVTIVDARDRCQPVGIPGELLIAGDGLARGYLHRPELTAERFIELELDGGRQRVYRTGDLARLSADGALEYLGRLDHQVKLRGFRIELGEIDSRLLRHPGVQDAVTVLCSPDENPFLTAYVCLREALDGAGETLRQWLGSQLPEYMIPARFMFLEQLPLTPNGKVDRKALPEPDAMATADNEAPRGDTEGLLASLWSGVLGEEIHDRRAHFFEAGGHSLLATRLVARLRDQLGVELPLWELFEYPVLADMAVRLREYLGTGDATTIPALPGDAPRVLSHAQQRLWFLVQLEGPSATYNIPMMFGLSGDLQLPALRQSFIQLVERHQSLRCCFPQVDGGVVVREIPAYDPLEITDLSELEAQAQQRAMAELAWQHATRVFDLANGPLFRLQLLVLGGGAYRLLLNLHHIIADGWSLGVLMRDWGEIYSALCEDRAPALVALPIQYSDYAAWQRDYLRGEALQGQLDYWLEQLAGAPPLLELPTDYPRPAVQSFRGAHLISRLDAPLTRELKALGQQQGCTLFMTLLAAFQALLHRHSGQDDILVGSPVANRGHSQTENLVGFFINTVVLRGRFPETLGVVELLARTRDTALAAYDHQDLPFEHLVERLNPQRALSHSPLFQVMFVLQNPDGGETILPDLRLLPMLQDAPIAKYDLALAAVESEGGLELHWEYAAELFRADTIQRLAGQFSRLLAGMVENPHAEIQRLPLLGEAEIQQLRQWNDTAVDYPQGETLVDLFAEQLARTPDNPAVVYGDTRLSYRELDRRANRLAQHLLASGAIADNGLVGVCARRSADLLVGLLGILKAGGAYVPLDPDSPRERLRFMLADSGVRVLLTQRALADRLPGDAVRLIRLDDPTALAEAPDHAPAIAIGPQDLAYVIYTSGSTGKPKGVMIEHAGVVNLVRWYQSAYDLDQNDRTTQLANPAFDGSVWEIWPHLCAGACVYPVDAELLASPARLLTWLDERRITIGFIPRPLWEQACGEGLDWPASLRAVLTGGDQLKTHPPAGLSLTLYNNYGPTENSVVATYTRVAPRREGDPGLPPIGRPIHNVQVHILDAHQQPQPIGVPGELCIGGAGLARGYLHRPELTAEKFLPVDLFGETRRLYRTGDLARWLADGRIEYLGRLDHQVKLRGFRIELGEIETTLMQHQAVKAAVVLLHERGEQQALAAYLTLHAAPLAPGELRTWLKARLPDYMIPASFTVLESLPLTPNGKLDRDALPAPDTADPGAIAPLQTETERLLAGLWSAVLGVQIHSREAEFFAVGGHSLLAARLTARIREDFGVDLPLRVLFEHPLLGELAAWLDQALRAGTGAAPPPIQPRPASEAPVLSHAQRRLWFLARMEGVGAVYNMPVALRLRGGLDVAALQGALEALVRRHDSLRVSFPAAGGEPTLRMHPPEAELQILDLRHLPPARRERRLAAQLHEFARRSLDLTAGAPWEARLLRLADEDQALLLNLHHIIGDGWSMAVLLREWSLFYNALSRGETASLAPLPVSYADHAAWQRHWLQGEVLDRQLDYWARTLAGAPELLELPTDYPRPAVMRYRGGHRRFVLDGDAPARVNRFSRERGVTPFMSLLAVFKILLYRYSGQTDLLVGTPIANRHHPHTAGLIGLFVNTVVLRSQLQPEQGLGALLAGLRQQALDAYSHQDLPFEQVVEHLNPARSLSHTPLFQVMFVFHNTPDHGLQLDGLTATALTPAADTAKFDLTLGIGERDGVLLCDWEYNGDLFHPDSIARMHRHFRALLDAALAAPDTPVAGLPLLDEAEQRQLLDWHPAPCADTPPPPTVVAGFQARVAARPQAVALVCGEQRLSYGELNARANRLAHHLRGQGVGTDTLVGLCLERSVALVVAMLGILKAGGAYLPLDPVNPAERLGFMVEDAGLDLVLTVSELADALPPGRARRLCLDTEAGTIAAQAATDPPGQSGPAHAAYVIYTSGSTGKPKGCVVSHANVSRLFSATEHWYGFHGDDVWTLFHSHAFDFSVWEIWGALLYGGRLVVVPYLTSRDPAAFYQLLIDQRVTVLNQTPSAFRQLIPVDRQPDALALRYVIFGGEALDFAALQPWFARHGGERPRLVNMYGITETTVHVTYHPLDPAGDHSRSLIGRPIPDLSVWVLDEHRQPVPPGLPGELYVGGAGVAQGYLNRPELSARRFLELEVLGRRQRLYRTGDRARLLPDGDLEYLGRVDHQLKLRGFRIEPGEIESLLKQHPGVEDALVLVHGEGEAARLVAYVASSGSIAGERLRTWLKDRLPGYMVPAECLALDRFPLTANGKLDRRALPVPGANPAPDEAPASPVPVDLAGRIAAIWRELLQREQVGLTDNFFDLGGHSLLLLRVQDRLQALLERPLPVTTLFQYPTIQDLVAHLQPAAATAPVPQVGARREVASDAIAIIGMAGRFPDAADIEAFWQNLRNGHESLRFFSDEELLARGVDPALLAHPDYVKAGMVLDDIEYFDAEFFGYNPKEAALLDPQLRIFLETAWTAMEHAGYDVSRLDAPVGAYAGAGSSTYLINNLLPNQAQLEGVNNLQLVLGDGHFSVASAAYKLNLTGPAVFLYTACSTALVAVHTACRALLDDECRMALAGGVAVPVPQGQGYLYQHGMIISPDGHCRAFDADARGTVGGAGVGIVVLKRLDEALADGDTIHAVIRGSGLNNDGTHKVGFTAPGVDGQAAVIRAAMGEIPFESIGYVETHGAGTELGDPIEVAALNQAYGGQNRRAEHCAIGSVKTNIGHLDTAAGAAGLIKTILALKHREIPPSLNFNSPNPRIDFAQGPFFVNTELRPWESVGPRRAGVSSFGIGGTNAHLVLEEAPTQGSDPADGAQLLCLSARSAEALGDYRQGLADYLEAHPTTNLADLAYTLACGRQTFEHRGCLVANSVAEALTVLRAAKTRHWRQARVTGQGPHIVFMFPGQGSQYVDMARGLYDTLAAFRDTVDYCSERLRPIMGRDLRQLIFPPPDENVDLQPAGVAQPTLFVIEYALAQLCLAWGIRPAAMIGHSLGEYTGACLAGVFSLDDALELVAVRGQLMEALPSGEMLSVLLGAKELQALLVAETHIAACNAPALTVVSGSAGGIAALGEILRERGVMFSRVNHANAAHSPMMQPILERLRKQLRGMTLKPPRLPCISNLTGDWLSSEQATSPDYWADHLCHTVQFSAGLQTLLDDNAVLLELGPDMSLTSFALQHQGSHPVKAFNLLRSPATRRDDRHWLLHSLGQLWLHDVNPDWSAVYRDARRLRIPAPTYPFQRRRYWIDASSAASHVDTGLRRALDDWFYLPTWRHSPPPALLAGEPSRVLSHWLIFSDTLGVGQALEQTLEGMGAQVIMAWPGNAFEQRAAREYRLDPGNRDDYQRLFFNILTATGRLPEGVLHLWDLDPHPDMAQVLERGFSSLLFIADTWPVQQQRRLLAVSRPVQAITGEEVLAPVHASLLGALQQAAAHHPDLRYRHIDVLAPESEAQVRQLTRQLLQECQRDGPARGVAYRQRQRWLQEPQALRLPASPDNPLRRGGAYVFSGPPGGRSLVIARWLAGSVQARLAFLTPGEPTPAQREALLALAADEVLVLPVDPTQPDTWQQRWAELQQRWGAVHGLFHATDSESPVLPEVRSARELSQPLADTLGHSAWLVGLEEATGLDFVLLHGDLRVHLPDTTLTAAESARLAHLEVLADTLQQRGIPAISLAWDHWQESATAGIRDAEVSGVLSRVLAHPQARLLLSTTALAPRLQAEAHSGPGDVHQEHSVGEDYLVPRTATEQAVAGMWQSLLGIQRIGAQDNFFKLGGHSLLGTQLVSRLRDSHGLEVALKTLFDYPVLEDLAAWLDSQEGESFSREIPCLPADATLPLSYAQQRLWVLAQIEGVSSNYNIPAVLQLDGVLDAAALRRAFMDLTERHASLRACFPMAAGQASIKINPVYDPLAVIDLGELSGAAQEQAVYEHTDQHAHLLFDLESGPLLSVQLLHLGATRHVLLLNIHHIIADGWSMGVLIRDWMHLYNAHARQQSAALPSLSIQYPDFAAWQRQWLNSGVMAEQRDYWSKKLTGMPELLDLPTDYPRPATICYDGESLQVALPAALSRRLKDFGAAHGCTLFMTMLAAFNTLLFRYSGQQDLAIGSPIANRNHGQIEDLVGFFVNTLILRNQLHGDMPFMELLAQVRQTALEAYGHQDISFEYLVEQLNPPRSMSHTPLVQVIFALQNVPREELELYDLRTSFLDPGHRTVQFDLVLSATEIGDMIACNWRYRTDLYARESISRMAEHFQILLEAILDDADRSLAALPLLSPRERCQLTAWNTRPGHYPGDRTVVALFQERVMASPDAIAVTHGDQQLSYRQLDARSNQLARYLRQQGVDGTSRVAVFSAPSLELVIALWGVLKAGSAYVPLDPNYPAGRLQHMLGDPALALVLTQEALWQRLPEQAPPVFCLDRDWAAVAALDDGPLPAHATPEGLIYMIYTSGSTGVPKGAAVYHRSFVNLLHWYIDELALTASDSTLIISAFSFDLTQKNFYAPLLAGGQLHLLPCGYYDPGVVAELVATRKITWLNCAPSAFYPLLEDASDPTFSQLDSLRHVVLGGEPIAIPRLRAWLRQQAGRTRLINSYGPTECTDVTVAHTLDDYSAAASMPIGSPIPNVVLHVLDAWQGSVPTGSVGELYIGGDCVGAGYLNDPVLTALKFLPDPFAPADSGRRLYRTGDLVRQRPDGKLDYVGRTDQQVKLRGFRIELGEIESHLGEHPAVKQVAVLLRQRDGVSRLVAHVSLHEALAEPSQTLREWLKQRLPDYMVPASISVLENLPLSPNGKIDRAALPEPAQCQGEIHEPPRPGVEQTLAAVWCRLLGLEGIDRHDNFFALGGDSILSIQLVVQAREADLHLSPRQVFQHQSLAELAAVARPGTAVVADQGPVSGEVVLTPIQRWLLRLGLTEVHHYNQSVLRRVPRDMDPQILRLAWAAVLDHHDSLRLRFPVVDGERVQIHGPAADATLSFSLEDLGDAADPAAALYDTTARYQASLDLEQGPLGRLVLMTWGNEARLFLCIHHLVVDGVSWRFLLDDLESAYRQIHAGGVARLPARTTSFQTWAARLREHADSAAVLAELGYWRGLPDLPLPVDRPHGANRLEHQREVELSLTPGETDDLLRAVPAAYDTRINDVLLTALALTLRDWSGRPDCLVDLEGHGRVPLFDEVDVSRTAGWFTTIFPVALRLPADTDPGAALLAVKAQLGAIPHQGIGYGLLRELRGESLPGADILFNYFGRFEQDTGAGLLRFADERVGPAVAPRGPRSHRLEVKAVVTQGCFHMSWCASRDCYHDTTLEGLAASYRRHLVALIRHCVAQSPST